MYLSICDLADTFTCTLYYEKFFLKFIKKPLSFGNKIVLLTTNLPIAINTLYSWSKTRKYYLFLANWINQISSKKKNRRTRTHQTLELNKHITEFYEWGVAVFFSPQLWTTFAKFEWRWRYEKEWKLPTARRWKLNDCVLVSIAFSWPLIGYASFRALGGWVGNTLCADVRARHSFSEYQRQSAVSE